MLELAFVVLRCMQTAALLLLFMLLASYVTATDEPSVAVPMLLGR